MKQFKSFLIESENIQGFENRDEAIEYILENCQQWFLEIYKKEIKTKKQLEMLLDDEYFLFRGKNIITPKNFIETATNDRKPRNSSNIFQKIVNDALLKLGFSTHRGNSLFCTNNQEVSEYYGETHFVFPIDGYHYLFSKNISDLYITFESSQDFYALSKRDEGVAPLFPNLEPFLKKELQGKMYVSHSEMFDIFLKKYSIDEVLEIFKIDEKVFQELYNFTNRGIRPFVTTNNEHSIEILIRPKAVLLELEE